MKKIFFILLFFISSLSFSNEITFENYVNKKFGYSLKIPKGTGISKKVNENGVLIESNDFVITVLGVKNENKIDSLSTIYDSMYLQKSLNAKANNVEIFYHKKDQNLLRISYIWPNNETAHEIYLYNYKRNIFYIIMSSSDKNYEKIDKILETMYYTLDEYPIN